MSKVTEVKEVKKKKEPYFGKSVEDAIIRFNSIENKYERDKLFRQKIYPAFDKLAEILIHTYKFYYIDDSVDRIKHKTVSFLVEKIHLYDLPKGKAYSYFTIVARNYLILENTNAYKAIVAKKNIDDVDLTVIVDDAVLNNEQRVKYFDNVLDHFSERLEEYFPKKRDYIIAESIVEILRRRESINNYNKKAIYILIRERTNCKSQHITSVVNSLKRHYKEVVDEFQKRLDDDMNEQTTAF